MKKALYAMAARIDALSLRERVTLTVTSVLATFALFNYGFLQAISDKQDKVVQQIQLDTTALNTIRSQIQALSGMPNPNVLIENNQAALNAKLSALQQQLATVKQELVAPDDMPRWLQTLLTRNGLLELTDLRTLAVTPITPALKQADSNGTPVLYKHAVELTLTGSYQDLLRYMESIDKMPGRVYWQRAHLKVLSYPTSSLTLTLFTLSMDEKWLKL